MLRTSWAPTGKLGAAVSQSIEQIDKRRILGPQVMRCTELRDHALGFPGPIHAEQCSRLWTRQNAHKNVAICRVQAIEPEDLRRRRVPSQYVPAPAGHIGGLIEVLDETPDRRRYDFGGEAAAARRQRQSLEVRMLDVGEAQRSSECIDRRKRRSDGPALLQTDVPVDANARKLGYLLASEARCAAPPTVRETDGFWP